MILSGFISTPDSSSGVGYVCSSLAEKDWPDIQYTLIGASTTIPIVSMAHNFKPGRFLGREIKNSKVAGN